MEEGMTAGYQQGFESLDREIVVDELPTAGQFPAWLRGTLVRNGPARFEVGAQPLRHWFDGLAMLHRFTIDGGRVSYANKFVRSPDFMAAQTGKLRYAQFATDPCRSIWKRVATLFSPELTQNTSISVSTIADRFVAWSETPVPLEFDPDTLETLGVIDFDDQLDVHTSTPHPQYDQGSGDMINASLRFDRISAYKLYCVPAGSQKRDLLATLPVKEPAYMHSFGLSENYIVLAEYPLVVNPLTMLLGNKPFAENLRWQPDRGTFFRVLRRDGTPVGNFRSEPFFCFHHVNAFETPNAIHVDLLAYPDDGVIQHLYLDVLRDRSRDVAPVVPAELRRYTLDFDTWETTSVSLSDERFELPRINDAMAHTKPYNYVYGVGLRPDRPNDFSNQLVKINITKRETLRWYADDCYPGEPIFVPTPGASAEDDGVILSVVLDGRRGTSFLLVLDARSFAEIARADVPQRIPFGFHGAFWSREQTQ